jgi:hypothetical protein
MPKKASGLTGGTGDVNPQWYRISLPAAITVSLTGGASPSINSTTVQFPVPVPKYPNSDGTAIVMEVLKTRWTNDFAFDPSSGAGVLLTQTSWLTTKAPTGTGLGSSPNLLSSPSDGSIIDINQGSTSYQNSVGSIVEFRFDPIRKNRADAVP